MSSGSSITRSISRAGSAAAGLIGLLALVGWVVGYTPFTAVGARWIPMAPSTALSFLVLGSASLILPSEGEDGARPLTSAAGALVILAALVLLVASSLGVRSEIEHLGLEIAGTVDGAPVGHMSPLTAFAFVLSGVSFLLLRARPVARSRARLRWARALATLVLVLAGALTVAYLLGGPLLYGSTVIPPALTTSVGFLALGASLLATSEGRLRAASATGSDAIPWTRRIASGAILLGVVIVGVSYVYFREYAAAFRADVADHLSTVAELEVDRLVQWRRERLSDAAVFFGNRHFSGVVRRALEDESGEGDLREWLSHVRNAYQYDRIALFDARGVERLTVPDPAESQDASHGSRDILEVLRSQEVRLRDFHRDSEGGPVHLTILVPVMDEAGLAGLGVLAIRADPRVYLYPQLASWPVPRRTAEMLLVRRKADHAVVLNPLSSRGNVPLELRVPIARSSVPAARAVLGSEGVMEGVDLGGERIVAAARAVPDSPWLLVAQIHASEAYAPLQERLWWVVGLVVVLLLGLGGLAGIVWQRRRTIHYESLARAEASLREKQAMLERTERIAHVGSWEYDLSTDEVTWSDEVFRIFGLDPSGEPPAYEEHDALYPPEDTRRLNEAVTEVIEHGGSYELELGALRGDELRRCLARGHAETDSEGNVVRLYGSFQDVTDLKRAEEERERLQAQLARSQRMEAVGQLAGGVAHDFNNMLSVILGQLELALDEVPASDPLSTCLQEARDAARRSAGLTRQLLTYARRQPVEPEVIDLNESVRQTLTMLDPLIGEDIRLSVRLAEDLGFVEIDPTQIDQVLTNLLINARDAITGVGEIWVETRNVTVESDDDPRADVPAGSYAVLTVRDDGSGIEEEVLDRIFEPFFTTKPTGENTGLGLSTVYGIVKQNGGFLHTASEVGRGTTFRVYLPRVTDDREPGSEAAHETDQGRPGSETILVVEDEQAVLRLIRRTLEKLGYTVLPADSPHRALELAREHEGEIDLLLTDVVMPEMNGRDLAERIRSILPDLGVVFMSGYTADVLKGEDALRAGEAFVQKPLSVEELTGKIRRALEQRGA